MTLGSDPLDRLAPALDWTADWDDVLRRADGLGRRAWRVRGLVFSGRRLALAAAVLAAALIPFAALGAANDWWFFDSPFPVPKPLDQVFVKNGEWDGHPWKLIAYRSDAGLCWSFTPILPNRREGSEAGAGCGPFAGVPGTRATKPDMTIGAISTSGGEFPAYIAGVVVESAREVEIQFGNGEKLQLPTFAAPESVGPIRYFASQRPGGDDPTHPGSGQSVPQRMIGRDGDGNVVACYTTKTASFALSGCALAGIAPSAGG
jgi:hypothetical protein